MKEGICKDAERQKSEIHEKYISSLYLFPKKKKIADWGPQKRHYTLSGLVFDSHILNPLPSILNPWFAIIVSEIRDWV